MDRFRRGGGTIRLLLLLTACGNDDVRLTSGDAGKTIPVPVGSSIEITLTTIGPGQYGAPQLSSSAVQFENMNFASTQSPGGPTQIFLLRCGARGSTVVTVPHMGGFSQSGAEKSFEVTVQCE